MHDGMQYAVCQGHEPLRVGNSTIFNVQTAKAISCPPLIMGLANIPIATDS